MLHQTTVRADRVSMPRREFVEEHKHLVKVLRHPTPAKLKTEAAKQAKELRGKH